MYILFIYLSQLVRGVQCPWFVFTTPEHLSNLKPVAEKRAVVLASNNESLTAGSLTPADLWVTDPS